MSPLTIGHFVRNYLPGSETFIYTMLRFQRAATPVVFAGRVTDLDSFPFEPIVETYPRQLAPGPRVVRRLAALGHGYRSAHDFALSRGLRHHGCDVLHAHFGMAGCLALPSAARLQLPLVTTFYGRDISMAERDPAWRERYRRLFSQGSLFLCEGSAMAEHLSRIGCPRERIRVVRIGLDLEYFPYQRRPRGRPLVFFQGARFVEKKGVDISIRAFAAAREELGESELWLVGDGESRASLERLADELGVIDRVRFLGMLSHDQYRDAIGRAHIGIQPSRTAADGDTEGGAPTSILEMQATGLPVVATRHADIPEVVAVAESLADEDDVGGVARAMVKAAALSDRDWGERCDAGRRLVERQHDARTIADSLDAIYREAVRDAGT